MFTVWIFQRFFFNWNSMIVRLWMFLEYICKKDHDNVHVLRLLFFLCYWYKRWPLDMFFWYYFDRNLKRTSNGCGCRNVFWSISVGTRSGKDFPSGSITVANCIRVAIKRNMRDLANTSPIQLLFPIPKASTLKID